MKTKSFLSEFFVLILLSLVPLPGPQISREPCPSDRSALVRSIVNKKWIPILQRYGLQLPIECPLHPMRDIFWPRQISKIRHRPSQWSCGLCGKSFYNDKFLDQHFEIKHPDHINMAEDAVCLADYCDIMRCAVWETSAMQSTTTNNNIPVTDVEVWKNTNALIVANTISHPSPTALQTVPILAHRGELAPFSLNIAGGTVKTSDINNKIKSSTTTSSSSIPQCTYFKTRSNNYQEDTNNDGENNTIDNAKCPQSVPSILTGTKEERLHTIKKFKENCHPETFKPLQDRCDSLVWNCLAGLITNLTTDEFKIIENEMKRAICWYLTCDRYWESTPQERRKFPWLLLLALVTGLALIISLCYYLIWLMCDFEDHGLLHREGISLKQSTLQARAMYVDSPEDLTDYYIESQMQAAGGAPDHYIYVTYPPELKRRLMEGCYNRTTRI